MVFRFSETQFLPRKVDGARFLYIHLQMTIGQLIDSSSLFQTAPIVLDPSFLSNKHRMRAVASKEFLGKFTVVVPAELRRILEKEDAEELIQILYDWEDLTKRSLGDWIGSKEFVSLASKILEGTSSSETVIQELPPDDRIRVQIVGEILEIHSPSVAKIAKDIILAAVGLKCRIVSFTKYIGVNLSYYLHQVVWTKVEEKLRWIRRVKGDLRDVLKTPGLAGTLFVSIIATTLGPQATLVTVPALSVVIFVLVTDGKGKITCPECGKKLSPLPDLNYCPKCGHAL